MAGGEALDLALGLLRAPARRGLLAARSLPTGMTTLLEVAGGSSSAARAAAASTGAAPGELLEAARFFVQQVMFTDSASAYRILGAQPDAPQAQLHAHHRLLQRWLHPDRDGGLAWDSAFSARVNEAWTRLRTPHARRAYDQELARSGGAPSAATPPGNWRTPDRLVPAVEAAAQAPRIPGLRSTAGPLAVIAAVLLCLWLLWLVHQRDLRAQADLFPPAAPAAALAAAPQGEPVEPLADHAAQLDPPGQAPGPVTQSDPVLPAEPVLALDPVFPMEAANQVESANQTAPAGRDEPVAPTGQGTATLAEAAAPPAPARLPPAPVVAPEPLPPPAAPDVIRTAATPAPPDVATTAAPALQAIAEEDPLQLLQQAEQTVSQTTAYLVSDGSHVPPIWRDVPARAAADQARARLHLRLDGDSAASIDLGSPHWRMDSKHAVLEAGYRVDGPPSDEQGRLRIEMSRGEQGWLVTRLHLEPAT